jgi:NAD(P)H-flavin reductase
MLITGIRSKPVYAPLQPDLGGRYHLLVGHGVGGAPLLRLLQQLQAQAPAATARTRILYVTDSAGAGCIEQFRAAAVAEVRAFEQAAALLAGLEQLLRESLMGTRLYVAGPESFMGLVMRLALQFNLMKDEIRAEECGSLARRVYCIHCRTVAEQVRTNIVECSGCARWLVVRDHYSRRLAAYMGVMVDAEAPGERPPIKEVFV